MDDIGENVKAEIDINKNIKIQDNGKDRGDKIRRL